MKAIVLADPRPRIFFHLRCFVVAVSFVLVAAAGAAQGPNPLDSNNSIYPTADEWAGGFRTANYAYPTDPVPSTWTPGADGGRITAATPCSTCCGSRNLSPPI